MGHCQVLIFVSVCCFGFWLVYFRRKNGNGTKIVLEAHSRSGPFWVTVPPPQSSPGNCPLLVKAQWPVNLCRSSLSFRSSLGSGDRVPAPYNQGLRVLLCLPPSVRSPQERWRRRWGWRRRRQVRPLNTPSRCWRAVGRWLNRQL